MKKPIKKPTWLRPELQQRLDLVNGRLGGLHTAVRHTLLWSRIIGLLPVSGLTNPLSTDVKFTLQSPYTLIYLTSMFGQILMSTLTFYRLFISGLSLSNVTNFLFYSLGLVSSLSLTTIGISWPKVLMEVEVIERYLPPFTRNIAKYCRVITYFVLISAFVEHFLCFFYGYVITYYCDKNDVVKRYFVNNMPWIFDYTSYSLWKAILAEIFNLQSTFMWSYNDLYIMVISIYLTEHFTLHNHLLRKSLKLEYFSCTEFRAQYLKIVRLVKLINHQIGVYILSSFGSNVYWTCLQLFNSLNTTGSKHHVICTNEGNNDIVISEVEHMIYFTYSFTFLVVRTMLVLLLAARIHSTSTLPLNTLYEVPSYKFDVEVQRYIDQVNNLKIALSGLDFFHVTRTMILTLVGTIITYELVLLQFNK